MDFLTEAPNLYSRYRQGDAFRRYVGRRLPLVVPALVVFFLISMASVSGAVVCIGGTHALLVLLCLVLAPFFLIGSLSVQLFVFFAWLERRALERLTGHRRSRRDEIPEVPWLLAAVFVGAPFVALALLTVKVAAALLLAGILTPVLYSYFDR